jgi:hypothetical protein
MIPLTQWNRRALIAALLLVTPWRVWAQQSAAHESVLELKVESADVVVRGIDARTVSPIRYELIPD